MKLQNLLIAAILFLMITGCTKFDDSVQPTNLGGSVAQTDSDVNLGGPWSLVQDSTANSMLHTSAVITNYIGTPNDYFDFRNDGYCYTKEGNVYDTLAYEVVSPEIIAMQNFGLVINGVIETSSLTFTAKTATIVTQNMLTPAGTLFRKVILKR